MQQTYFLNLSNFIPDIGQNSVYYFCDTIIGDTYNGKYCVGTNCGIGTQIILIDDRDATKPTEIYQCNFLDGEIRLTKLTGTETVTGTVLELGPQIITQ